MQERSVLVARVSSTGQDEDNQIPDLQGWSESHGYVVAGTVRIHGKSAFHGEHKAELYKAVRMIETGVADVLVMWTLDRSSRQGLDAAVEFRAAVRRAGGRLEFTEEPELNGDDNNADEAFAQAAIEARRESEKRIRRIETGNRKTVDNGAAIRKPKFGWALGGRKRRKEWVIDDGKAVIVRGIFREAAEGSSLREIKEWAWGQPGGADLDTSYIRRMIMDTAYIGEAKTTVNGQPYVYACPSIVGLELWQRANAMLKEPRRYARAAVSELAGIIRCGNCEAVMRRTSPGTGKRKDSGRYWRCPDGCGNVKYDVFNSRADAALRSLSADLYSETLVKETDMRQVRLTLLESELSGIGRAGLSPADMISRISGISAEMEAVKAEPAPRAKIIRQPSGVTVGAAYSALDHGNAGAVNAWLKEHNVRVWCGGPTAQIALRESSRVGADGQAAYVESGLVLTWWLTEE
jgi:DNA invertase Pin-like site-specific DNA recombinase